MVGPTIGPTLGGWLTDNHGWRRSVFINIPIGVLAAVMIAGYVKNPAHQKHPRSIDYMGIAFLIASVSAIQYVLVHDERDDWFASSVITMLVVIGVVGGALLAWRKLAQGTGLYNFFRQLGGTFVAKSQAAPGQRAVTQITFILVNGLVLA